MIIAHKYVKSSFFLPKYESLLLRMTFSELVNVDGCCLYFPAGNESQNTCKMSNLRFESEVNTKFGGFVEITLIFIYTLGSFCVYWNM